MIRKSVVLLFLLAGSFSAISQASTSSDSTKARSDSSVKTGTIKPYKDVITSKAITKRGLFTVHNVDDKWFFEIADSILGREIMAVTRYTGTPGGATFYAGELVNEQVIYFEKGPGNKLFIRTSYYVNEASDTQNIYHAVKSSSINPISAALDIEAIGSDNGLVVNVTEFFKGDNQIVSVRQTTKRINNLGSIAADRSFITRIDAFPINVEVKTIKTFTTSPQSNLNLFFGSRQIPSVAGTGVMTLQLNTSFVALPKEPMRKRYFDERVGYFANASTVFDDNTQKAEEKQYIVRWRLEPKPQDIEKFKRGELVEPANPIVYYIDPATPKKWIPYLKKGVTDWQIAFEQAGFKNAILAKEWPKDDTTRSLEDARFSVIRYLASPIPNAYGPNVHDPRTGEIIESHIGWYHNVMQLLHNWYMIQAGAVDPAARKMEFDDELMGELIRFVSSHEIGHTLGLRHNMGASSQTPVEKLRDKEWVEANGHTVSIMDYARFNYVAQPEDSIGRPGIFPRIGAYDKWAIQWGYTPIFGTENENEDKKILNKWIVDSLASNPRLWFGGEGIIGDPRSQMEDLGDDPVKASSYGIKNLRHVINGLPQWTREEGDLYVNYQRMYDALVSQFLRYLYHVAKNIGGMYITARSVEQPGVVAQPVPKERVQQSVQFFKEQVFRTPLWLYPDSVKQFLTVRVLDHLGDIQNKILGTLVNAAALLQVNEMANLSDEPYELFEYMDDLKKAVWEELYISQHIDIYRRNLQKIYIQKLSEVLIPAEPVATGGMIIIQPSAKHSDVTSIVRQQLEQLKRDIKKKIRQSKDDLTIYHLKDISSRIDLILGTK